MIITKLTIENLGLFRGQYTFNLNPIFSNGITKPIVLIGGKNGAGKTTLFEAFRLCLYGPNLQDKRFSKNQYEKYLSNKIHHISGSQVQPSEAQVEVEFEYSHLGKVDRYTVNRSWQINNKKVVENLTIKKNGGLLTDYDADQWQDFINDLLPPGISELFFFDGEKIQHLAEDQENNGHLKDSFKSLLGLDIVERLQSDLKIYTGRHLKEIGREEVGNKIIELEKEKEEYEELLDRAFQDRAQLQSQHDQIVGEIERQELNISSAGGSFASKRDKLKNDKAKLNAEIGIVENQIRELSHNLLPFAITPKYCLSLKKRLIEEEDYQKWKSTQTTLNSKKKEIYEKIQSPQIWNDVEVSSPIQKIVIEKISQIVDDAMEPPNKFANFKPVHQLSQLEMQKIITWIDFSLEDVPNQLIDRTKRLEKLTRKLQNVEKNLIRAPKDDVLQPLIQRLNKLNIDLGKIQEKIKSKDEEIRQIEFKLTDCERRLKTQIEEVQAHSDLSTRLKLCDNIQTVLKEYTLHLRKEKIKEFNEVFLAYFNGLSRKGNLIRRVEIDEDDFSVTLYEYGDKEIPKKQLSAGEKQIYAISMLWALTKISGRPLPFIIDTPLGRLDSDHRGTLVMNFFPNASHQMIIFSTDTEVDKKYFEDLKPYIARDYHLEYSEKEKMTTPNQGYFWKSQEELIDELQ